MLDGVLEFQRDMISENTKEGVAAATASGKTLGRPAALDEAEAATVVNAYRDGAAVKALARRYGVAPKTIRRVLDESGTNRGRRGKDDLVDVSGGGRGRVVLRSSVTWATASALRGR